MRTDGSFFSRFKKENRTFSPLTFKAAEDAVSKLLNPPALPEGKPGASSDHPGVILGKVQSGKTRTFLTTMVLAFDNGYDIALIFTKCSKPLLVQTLNRIKRDLSIFIKEREMSVEDILAVRDKKLMRRFEFEQKLIFVCKKQKDNMSRLQEFLVNHRDIIKEKNVLIIDDEGDATSISYSRKDGQLIANPIPTWISDIVSELTKSSYLTVTATPQSLYAQPYEINVSNRSVFRPVRPTFTILAPVGEGYIGGDTFYLYNENDEALSKVRDLIFSAVSLLEMEHMTHQQRRHFRGVNLLEINDFARLRHALVNFLVGGSILSINRKAKGLSINERLFAFVIHTQTGKPSHAWQELVVLEIIEALKSACSPGSSRSQMEKFEELIKQSLDDLTASLEITKDPIPSRSEVLQAVKSALHDDKILTQIVNSDSQLENLLDESGQLNLRVPFNIFIGGQVLDRGITINNLIGFYYGRDPRIRQQDTVIQHQRIYGYRRGEIGVTRIYTLPDLYRDLVNLEAYDHALRKRVEEKIKDGKDGSVRFIQCSSDGRLIPCGPAKVRASQTAVLEPGRRLIHYGFQVKKEKEARPIYENILKRLENIGAIGNSTPVLVPIKDALELYRISQKAFDNGHEPQYIDYDWRIAEDCLEYLSAQDTSNMVLVWAITGRTMRRLAGPTSHVFYNNAPDSQRDVDLWRRHAINQPLLYFLGQEGSLEQGWSGVPFFWPVIRAQQSSPTCIYCLN